MAKLNTLFKVKYGSNIELSNTEISDKTNGYPFVSRTEKNNGVSAYVIKQPDNVAINPANTLSVAMGGSVLETFYQDKEYYSGRDIAYLEPLIDMTKEEMLYYALCIKANRIKYSYGRQANRTLKDIELPDYSEIPFWVNTHKVGNIELLEPEQDIKINKSQCEDVHLFRLFNVERGYSPSIQDMLMSPGETPIVSSTGQNNGVVGFTSNPPNFNTEVGSTCLTLATNGSIGSCFYQDEPFIATGNVSVLVPKSGVTINRYNAIYIATLLKREGQLKYCYGRIWDENLVKNTQIKFPIKDGEIDWKLIETYIKTIEDKYRINMNENIKPKTNI